MQQERLLNVKYAAAQGLFFAGACALNGYAAVYLEGVGFSQTLIGLVIAVGSLGAALLQPLITQYADKRHLDANRVIAVCLAAVCAVVAAMCALMGVGAVTGVLFVLAVALSGSLVPLYNVLAFKFEQYGVQLAYGVSRGTGSATYALTSLALGNLLQTLDIRIIPLTAIAAYAVAIPFLWSLGLDGQRAGAAAVAATTSAQGGATPAQDDSQPTAGTGSYLDFFRRYPRFSLFVLGTICVFFTSTMIGNFFISFVQDVGGDTASMGSALFLSAMSELPAMLLVERLKGRVRASALLKVAAVFFTVKHLLMLLATSMTTVYVSMAFQMVSYAIMVPASVYYANEAVTGRDASKGQVLVAMSQTVAGIFSSVVTGALIDAMGTHATLLVGVLVSAVGTALVLGFAGSREG